MAVDMLSRIWELKAESAVLWQYFLLGVPKIVYQMTPVSCLMATIFTVNFLSRSNELTALFSAGMSLARISAPILTVSALIAVASFFISDKLIPPFTKKQNYVYYVDIK